MFPPHTFPSQPAAPRDGVVLLHGIARSPGSMKSLERALRHQGYATLNLGYPSRRQSLQQLVQTLHPTIDTFAHSLSGKLHFVTHSMGGLVARAYLNTHTPANLGCAVMLSPPNQGSELADALHTLWLYRWYYGPAGQQLTTLQTKDLQDLLGTPTYPVGIIAGTASVNPVTSRWFLPQPNDGAVAVARMHLPQQTGFVEIPASHTFMARYGAVQAAVLRFLQTEAF